MKTTKRLILFFILLSLSKLSFAQEVQIPKDYKLVAKEDYGIYERDVLNCINWIESVSWTEQQEKREEAKVFLIKWISGSPTVSIMISESVGKLFDKNPELLGSYMYGYTKYVLENSYDQDKLKASLTAVKTLLAKYVKEKTAVKDKDVEKLLAIEKEGKLESWTQENLLK
ncbi:hypothetical protein NF867_13600 [Solitalea sp. MAHUQ-68]|uniref:HEAT repeat domain-containing protein n=1 Tax=Solitalea agri TaxID=2953739 RepID=A0A9X2F353_9SPHI|nr:hypothetical protein [Solitalea agri]MCO4293894.1 hypothetical protein [Solitalea agri]